MRIGSYPPHSSQAGAGDQEVSGQGYGPLAALAGPTECQ
jgi:hypothetical protein